LAQIGPGEEARVRQQTLVDRTELVDAELCVADASPALPAPLFRQAQERDDPLQRTVPEANARQQRRLGVVEQPAAQSGDAEARAVEGLELLAVEAVPMCDQREQLAQAGVEVGALLGL